MAWAWDYDWSSSDDGSPFSGADIEKIQDDIVSQAVDMASAQTITGNKTFSGTIVLSGAVTLSGAVNLPATGVIIGTANQGDIFFDDGTDLHRLTPGTDGEVLKTQGAGADPQWASADPTGSAGGVLGGTYPNPSLGNNFIKQVLYFHGPDFYSQDEVVAFGMGDAMLVDNKEESYLEEAITFTGLAAGDLVDGIVSRQCFNFDGTNDYAIITDNVAHDVGGAMTLEVWFYKDATGTMYLFSDDDATPAILLYITDTNVYCDVETNLAHGIVDVAHGLDSSGIEARVYVVVTWATATVVYAYINGVSVGNGNAPGGTVVVAVGLCVGCDKAQGNKWDGKIDGLRYLKRQMSATEILARYNTFK